MFQARIGVAGNKRICAWPQKRLTWGHREVMYFLNILKQKKQLGKFDRIQVRVVDFFKGIEETMNVAGFQKTATQLSVKFKNLKAEYFRCKRNNTDLISKGKVFPYFKIMGELLAPEEKEFEIPGLDWYNNDSSGPTIKTEPDADIEIEEQPMNEECDAEAETNYFIYEEAVQACGTVVDVRWRVNLLPRLPVQSLSPLITTSLKLL